MYKLITAVLCFLLLSCSNAPTNSQLSMSDIHAIEEVSAGLTNLQIDSIVMTARGRAIIYYKSDTIDSYMSSCSYLWVFNVYSLDSSSSMYHSKSVRVDNWISDSNYLTRYKKINMKSDSIHFSANTYDTIPIDTLRTVLLYLSDLTVCDTILQYSLDPTFCNKTPQCDFEVCYKVPLDSMTSISWDHKQDTIIIEMSQRKDNYSGISWTFKLFDGITKLWSRSRWME